MSHDTATPGYPDPSEPPDVPAARELPDIHNVHRVKSLWHATHPGGDVISAPSWPELEAEACAIRVRAQWLRTTWSDGPTL